VIGTKILGIPPADIKTAGAYRQSMTLPSHEADEVTRSRYLAYATNTWKRHASYIRSFLKFCENRSLNIFDCTPSVINLFLIKEAQNSKTTGVIESFLDAYSFVMKFFEMPNHANVNSVTEIKRFVEKVTVRNTRTRAAFGAAEVRILWEKLTAKYGPIESRSKMQLRSFTLAIFQHSTFCRFSDVEKIKLDDVMFHTDYFKVYIRCSKTDQAGNGSYVYVPKANTGFRDPHMLMCVYIQKMEFEKCKSEDLYLFPPLK
jgi:integrase